MNLSKFEGIREYHEGTAVSEYVNTIPLGDRVLDRVGEKMLVQYTGTGRVRGYYIDSLNNIYVVTNDTIRRYKYDSLKDEVTYVGTMAGMVGNTWKSTFELRNGTGKVTFCESSTKPSQVYMCDGKYIYWWNTTSPSDDCATKLLEFTVNMLLSPGATVDDWNGQDQYQQLDDLNPELDLSGIASIDNVTWFDNRLVATQREKNTVWLTCTDPGQFLRDLEKDPVNGEAVQLWSDWYSSTNSADRLNQAIGFAGQLYLLNEGTIEIWSRTGTEDSPLQPNSLNTIYHGGRSPLILANIMFLICKDQIGGEFVGAIQAGGQFKRISNAEIERRFRNKMADIVPILVREDSFICVRDTDSQGDPTRHGYCYGTAGFWWKWYNQDSAKEFVAASIVKDICISNLGSIMRMDRNSRRLTDGTPVVRFLRDGFTHFEGRKIIRAVEPVMDTGVSFDEEDDEIYCRVSTDRGRTFGQFRYRKLGKQGHNDKSIVWRNMDSGNSMLIEIGTSSNYQLQIYRIFITLG